MSQAFRHFRHPSPYSRHTCQPRPSARSRRPARPGSTHWPAQCSHWPARCLHSSGHSIRRWRSSGLRPASGLLRPCRDWRDWNCCSRSADSSGQQRPLIGLAGLSWLNQTAACPGWRSCSRSRACLRPAWTGIPASGAGFGSLALPLARSQALVFRSVPAAMRRQRQPVRKARSQALVFRSVPAAMRHPVRPVQPVQPGLSFVRVRWLAAGIAGLGGPRSCRMCCNGIQPPCSCRRRTWTAPPDCSENTISHQGLHPDSPASCFRSEVPPARSVPAHKYRWHSLAGRLSAVVALARSADHHRRRPCRAGPWRRTHRRGPVGPPDSRAAVGRAGRSRFPFGERGTGLTLAPAPQQPSSRRRFACWHRRLPHRLLQLPIRQLLKLLARLQSLLLLACHHLNICIH